MVTRTKLHISGSYIAERRMWGFLWSSCYTDTWEYPILYESEEEALEVCKNYCAVFNQTRKRKREVANYIPVIVECKE